MRTTITLDADVAAGIAAAQRRHGWSFKSTVNELLREALQRPKPAAELPPLTPPPRRRGLKPGFSYGNIEEMLEQADGPRRK